MTDLLSALLLGIIEGITEFLPISSTGHLLIAERWLGARSDLFNIAIQAGAILAVVAIYRQRLWQLLLGLGQKSKRDYALKLALAFAITGALGLAVKKLGFQLPETLGPVAWALLIGGFVILAVEAIDARRADLPDADPDAIGWGTAALVGLAQVLAGVFPGTSRSAAAIFAALLFGRSSRVAATEFAFLVGIPTMFAATGYELLHTLKDGGAASEDWSALAVAFVVSALTAFAAVKWLLRYIQTHRFTVFAWYRIALGAALLVWLAQGNAVASAGAAVAGQGQSTEAGLLAAAPAGSTAHANAKADVGAHALAAAAARPAAFRNATLDDSGMFRLVFSCYQDDEQRRMLAMPGFEQMQAHTMGHASEEERRKSEIALAEMKARLARHRSECDGVSDHLLDGSAYELMLAAANQGDREAAHCYVSAQMPMSRARANDTAFFAEYRRNALRLIEQGMAAGDAWMLGPAAAASNPSPDLQAWQWREYEGPRYAWLMRLREPDQRAGNVRQYAIALLQGLVSPMPDDANPHTAEAIMRGWLSDEEAKRAEEWAVAQFRTAFHGRKAAPQAKSLCLEF